MDTLNAALRFRPDFDSARLRAAWISYDDNDNDEASTYIKPVLTRVHRFERESTAVQSMMLEAQALQ